MAFSEISELNCVTFNHRNHPKLIIPQEVSVILVSSLKKGPKQKVYKILLQNEPVTFWYAQTSHCSLLLSLETTNAVWSVA